MKLNDSHIQMLVNPRALKLNNILIIIKNIINIKDDIETLKINENLKENLVNAVRDINELNKYINLSTIDFTKKLLNIVGCKGKDCDKAVKLLFKEYYEDDVDEFDIKYTYFDKAIFKVNHFTPKIIDFSKSHDLLYFREKTIGFDFIVKWQQMLWEDILNEYMNVKYFPIHFIKKYNRSVISLTILHPDSTGCTIQAFKENLINWAMAQGLIETENDVNVIDDVKNNAVIICITFAL